MAKLKTIIKLVIPAGQATPAPPIGPAIGQHGLNIAEFCKKFNDLSKDKIGQKLPIRVKVFEDRTYEIMVKTPVTSDLIKKSVGIEKGSGKSLKEKVGKISRAKLEEIAKIKIADLNTEDIKEAAKIIEGTAKQMGLEIVD